MRQVNETLPSRSSAAKARGPYRIFLSHGHGDNYLTEKLIKPKLIAAGAVVFVDLDLEGGADFRARVFDELSVADELCVLLTPTSVKRPWIYAELGVAIHRDITVVSLIYGVEKKLSKKGILSLLGTHLYLQFDELDKYLQQAAARIERHRHG